MKDDGGCASLSCFLLHLLSLVNGREREERRRENVRLGTIAQGAEERQRQRERERKESETERARQEYFLPELILKQSFLFSVCVCAFAANLSAMSTIVSVLFLCLLTFEIVVGQNQITGK